MVSEEASVSKTVVNVFFDFLVSVLTVCLIFCLACNLNITQNIMQSQHCGSLHGFIWLKESQTFLSALTFLGESMVIRETSTSVALCFPSLSTWILTMLWKLAWILHVKPWFPVLPLCHRHSMYFILTFSLYLPLLWSSSCYCLPLDCLTFPTETCFCIHPAFQKSFVSKFLTYIRVL